MEYKTVTCKYCGNMTPATGVFCMVCGERLARKKREKVREITVPKPRRLASGAYMGQVMINGVRETVTGATEEEYRERARAIKSGVLEAKAKNKPVKLAEAIDGYIKSRDLSPETVRGYRTIQRGRYADLMQRDVWTITAEEIRDAIRDEKKQYRIPKARKLPGGKWGAVVSCGAESAKIAGSTPEEYAKKAQELKREKLGGKLSPKTQANDRGLICSVIHFVTGRRLEVRTAKAIRKEHLFLEPEQIAIFCRAIKGTDAEIPALLALSSLRRSELMHLDWSAVDLKKRLILVAGADVYDENNKRVSKDENKNDSSRRRVPVMMDQLRDALQAVPDKTGRVVRCAPDTVRRRINAICRAEGLPEIGTHGLRHSYASLAAHIKMPLQIAQEIGGWANDRIMREIYTHVAQTDRDRYKNDMADWFNQQNYYQITTDEQKIQ